MSAWFASGRIAGLVLVLTLLEAVLVVLLRRRTGRGPAPMLKTLGAGGCLLLAWYCSAAGFWWGYSAAGLLGALGFHVADVLGRQEQQRMQK